MQKTKHATTTLLLSLAATCLMSSNAATPPLVLSSTSGKTPLEIKVLGPAPLLARIKKQDKDLQPEWSQVEIDWGDGSRPYPFTPGGYAHTYYRPGKYVVKAKVMHYDGNDREIIEWKGNASLVVMGSPVKPPPAKAQPDPFVRLIERKSTTEIPLSHTEGNNREVVLAYPIGSPEPFSFIIDWGDGTPLQRETRAVDPGTKEVELKHVYNKTGSFQIRIRSNQPDGVPPEKRKEYRSINHWIE